MNPSVLFLISAAFLASAVEAVEALTVVLAAGTTRGWRSAFAGAAVAIVALAVLIAAVGPSLVSLPIHMLRVMVGALLLVFGLQWLRKAILRAGGHKALRDEAMLYRSHVEEARVAERGSGARLDWYGFTLAFKAVFLEGLEVAFIVLTIGASHGSIALAALGAGIALILVVIVGAFVHKPLARVPENTMKFTVGLLLSAFGVFWSAEGAGVAWPGSELALLGILVWLTAGSLICVAALRIMSEPVPAAGAPALTRRD